MSTSESVSDHESLSGWDAVRELPPSAKLVAKILEHNELLSQGEIAKETLLPPRTVRYALTRLDDAGVIEVQFCFSDARKRYYCLDI